VQAMEILRFAPQSSAVPVGNSGSAVANAEENFGVSRDDLFVAKSLPTRRLPANGAVLGHAVASNRSCRRSSHVTVVLRERETA